MSTSRLTCMCFLLPGVDRVWSAAIGVIFRMVLVLLLKPTANSTNRFRTSPTQKNSIDELQIQLFWERTGVHCPSNNSIGQSAVHLIHDIPGVVGSKLHAIYGICIQGNTNTRSSWPEITYGICIYGNMDGIMEFKECQIETVLF